MGKKPSIHSQAYDYIKQKITSCEYAPNQMISESLIQNELGCSRTPVREAIGRLAQEGLVNVYPKQGIVVCGIHVNDIQQIYEVRTLIEPYAIRTRGGQLDPGQLRRFAGIFRTYRSDGPSHPRSPADQLTDYYELDDQFHFLLLSGLNNDYLLSLYSRIHTQTVRLRIISGETQSRIAETMEEHLQIAAACLERDWEAAAKAMETHLERAKYSALSAILQVPSDASIL